MAAILSRTQWVKPTEECQQIAFLYWYVLIMENAHAIIICYVAFMIRGGGDELICDLMK